MVVVGGGNVVVVVVGANVVVVVVELVVVRTRAAACVVDVADEADPFFLLLPPATAPMMRMRTIVQMAPDQHLDLHRGHGPSSETMAIFKGVGGWSISGRRIWRQRTEHLMGRLSTLMKTVRSSICLLVLTTLVFTLIGASPSDAGTRLSAHATSSECNGTLASGTVAGMAATADDGGYWIANSQGLVVACGNAFPFGGLASVPNRPVVGIAATPDGDGYYLVASDGGVFAFGDAVFQGSTGGMRLNRPVVGMTVDSATGGYWLVASDGGIFAYNAPFFGSTGSLMLNQPVVGMAQSNAGNGYWLVASDGGIFAYQAPFWGSTGSLRLNKPVVGMAADSATNGYWLVASDGGIFAYNAPFFGSTGSLVLNKPIVGMEAATTGSGYRFVASDGGIFTFGSSAFYGSAVAPISSLVYTGRGWDGGGLQGPMPAPGTCHYGSSNGYTLPDPGCTPGAVDTSVTQGNIQSTICVTGYTTTVRPPESLTEPDKYQSMAAYSSPGTASNYEYDHLVPLELGGSSDVRNLWPEPYATGSYTKDGVEARLNHVVCSGQVSLAAAQQAIATNWTNAEAVLGVGP